MRFSQTSIRPVMYRDMGLLGGVRLERQQLGPTPGGTGVGPVGPWGRDRRRGDPLGCAVYSSRWGRGRQPPNAGTVYGPLTVGVGRGRVGGSGGVMQGPTRTTGGCDGCDRWPGEPAVALTIAGHPAIWNVDCERLPSVLPSSCAAPPAMEAR